MPKSITFISDEDILGIHHSLFKAKSDTHDDFDYWRQLYLTDVSLLLKKIEQHEQELLDQYHEAREAGERSVMSNLREFMADMEETYAS